MTVHSVADAATPDASRNLQQLCKHFAHKRPVTFDPQTGQISFSSGGCRLAAGGSALELSLTSPDADQLAQLQDVVAPPGTLRIPRADADRSACPARRRARPVMSW